ncbi:MAG: helix-turn-helix domain-containing protein [Rhizobiales bacterium]|nr:helix-turn-helix domain-containing protein [Hyphomicrobiales bacterium]
MDSHKHAELGSFLRSRRERLRPEMVGLADGRRRRTAGLRREEVAERAGIGVDWYVRLEQGRAVSPSVTTVDALARALLLDEAEHAHLRLLTQHAGPRAFETETVPDTIRRMLAGLNAPAYVTGRRWDVLAWNDAADALFAYSRIPEADRNTLISMLTNEKTRRLFGEAWEGEARRMIAEFRAIHDLWSGDPAFVSLLERLRAGCPEFQGWWDSHDIRHAQAGRKQLHFRARGTQQFEYVSFQANDDPALKLVIYTAVP